MVIAIAAIGFLLMLHPPANPRQAEVEKALQSGLSWHYRWVEQIPAGVELIECTVAVSDVRGFASCAPVSLHIDFEVEGASSPRVINIVPELLSFERELWRLRGGLRAPRNQMGGPVVYKVALASRDIASCKIDLDLTMKAPALALSHRQRKAAQGSLTLRYPKVCEDDPFYFIYFMRGEQIDGIQLFRISPDSIDLTWSFDRDSKQREIPKLAIENLNKPELWFREDPPEKE